MTDARQLMDQTREQPKSAEDQLFGHPYLAALEEGRKASE